MNRWLLSSLSVAGIVFCTSPLSAEEPPRVLELRTQKVEGTTYFHVRLGQPADFRLPTFDTSKPFSESDRRKFARLPRLVPQDGKTRILKHYRFKDFVEAMRFVNAMAGLAEAEGHHPDFCVHWNAVDVTLWTHAIGGLSDNDFIVAAKLDRLPEAGRARP